MVSYSSGTEQEEETVEEVVEETLQETVEETVEETEDIGEMWETMNDAAEEMYRRALVKVGEKMENS